MPMRRRFSGTLIPPAESKKTWSPKTMRPRSGVSSPAMLRKVVVLPHPLGPSRVKKVPGSRVKLVSRTPPAGPCRLR